MTDSFPRHLLVAALAALLAHGLCLGVPFYMDDQAHLLMSPIIQEGFDALFYRSLFIPFRAFAYAIWITLQALAGFSSVAFHALNLILHVGVTIAVYFASRELLRFSSNSGGASAASGGVAFWGAMLFAVHPIGTEVTHYAAQTTIQWVTLGSVLAVYFTLRWLSTARRRWFLAVIGAFLLATFSKEPGVYHAGGNILLTLLLLGPVRECARKAGKRPLLSLGIGVALAAAALLILNFSGWTNVIRASVFTPVILFNFLTQARVFWEYAWLLFVPFSLCSDHFLPRTISTGDAVAWIALTGVVLVLLGNVILALRGRRLPSLVLALFLAPILLRFLYRFGEVMVEYRLYPALPWFGLGLALVIYQAAQRKPAIAPWICGVLSGIFLLLSVSRSLVWQSESSIVENIIKQYPLHLRIHSYLQALDYREGRYENVIRQQKTMEQNLNAVLQFNRESDHHHRQFEPEKALAAFMLSEQFVGYAYIQSGRPGIAVERMTEVIQSMLRFFPSDESRAFAVLYRVRGKAKAALNDQKGAREDYARCLERKPGDRETLGLLEELGEP